MDEVTKKLIEQYEARIKELSETNAFLKQQMAIVSLSIPKRKQREKRVDIPVGVDKPMFESP